MTEPHSLDRYLPEQARTYIEQTYYDRVHAQARLEAIINDPEFRAAPELHPALYSDHSEVHVRDVAHNLLQVLDSINGVLIPAREPDRLNNFMKSYGLAVAYLHDIGMIDFSAIGRVMHPEFAAQAVFAPESDNFIETIWAANCGGLADYLADLHRQQIITLEPRIVLREMLALSMCHSKSKVPVQLMNDPAALRNLMQLSLSTDLSILYRQQQVEKLRAQLQTAPLNVEREGALALLQQSIDDAETALIHTRHSANSNRQRDNLKRFYTDFDQESFPWLVTDQAAARTLVVDVIDTLRALRCADALRQRGGVLKTSGNYEVFIDQSNAQAVYALRWGDDRLYLMSASRAILVGEANIAGSELDARGNLRITFQRGAFADPATTHYAAQCCAVIVNDIQSDVIESFRRSRYETTPHLKSPDEMLILLEGVADNINFADMVRAELIQLNPSLKNQIQSVPSLEDAAERERARYLAASDLDWGIDRKQALLQKVEASGQRIDQIDLVEGFRHIRLITLRTGETLLDAGALSSFVYIPLDAGLMIIPLGGYQTFVVQAWMPLGVTGVIRGAARNASIVAEKDVSLLIIPKEVFLKHWYHPHSLDELIDLLQPKKI
jgi:hypothetical protein